MDASTAKGCGYCGSHKHGTLTCFMGKLPKNGKPMLTEVKRRVKSSFKPVPTITIKELSYLISLARKKALFQYEGLDVNDTIEHIFKKVREQLNLKARSKL